MKIKTRQSIQVEEEITLPHFRGSEYNFYKIISENEVINIAIYLESFEIRKSDTLLTCAFMDSTKEISEETFKEKFNEVMSKINSLNV